VTHFFRDCRTSHTPCGLMFPKKVPIDCVNCREVVHVLHEELYNHVDSFSNKTHLRKSVHMRTVVLTTFPSSLPLASDLKTLFKFCSAWRICASTPPSTNAPVLGSKPRHPDPETNTKPEGGHTMAWLYPNRFGCICSIIDHHGKCFGEHKPAR